MKSLAHRLVEQVMHRGAHYGISGEVIRFGLVGTLGFMTDASVLTFLVRVVGWGPYESRPISFLAAISLTWTLNRIFTFYQRAGSNRRREYGRYLAVQLVGALVNFAVYAAVLLWYPALERYPALPLAAGSIVAMSFNFVGVRWFAFDRGGQAASVTSNAQAQEVKVSPPPH